MNFSQLGTSLAPIQGFMAFVQGEMADANEVAEKTRTTWDQLQDAFWALLIFVLPVVLAIMLGRFLARQLRMESHAWRLSTIFATIVAAAIIVMNMWPPKFGVDLRGGAYIIGELADQEEVDPSARVEAQDIIQILRNRIDPSGVREITIRNRGKKQIEVIIPDANDQEAERTWKLLTTAGHLMFRIVADEQIATHSALISRAKETASERRRDVITEPSSKYPDGVIGKWFSLARLSQQDEITQAAGFAPFKFTPSVTHVVRDADTGRIIDTTNAPRADDGGVSFTRWVQDVQKVQDLEILMVQPEERRNVEGEHLRGVRSGFDQNGNPAVHFSTTTTGSKRLSRLTNANKPKDGKYRLLGIVLDEKLDSAPRINTVINDQGIIQGRFTQQEVDNLVSILKSGKLKVALKDNWISYNQIESTLGNQLKNKGFLAIGVSMGLVLIFMLFYYRFSGIVACMALLLNLLLILSLILLVKQALTLAGLAGLVLTVGMSVDANVLIFERIREELNRGAALRMAIRNGFDRATTTIVDANVTTLITAVILYLIGNEQLKSFAVTLILGILMGMFTAIFCARVVFEIAERKRWVSRLSMLQILSGKTIDFLSLRNLGATASLIVIAVGLTGVVMRGGTMLDKDLRGGTTARIVLNEESTASKLAELLNATDYRFPPRDEKVDFEVTPMQGDPKTFIIDSNLPALEEELTQDDQEHPRLEEILADELQGKLAMLSMNYDPNSIKLVKLSDEEDSADENSTGDESTGGNQDGAHLDQLPPVRNRQLDAFGKLELAGHSWQNALAMLIDPAVWLAQQDPESTGQAESAGDSTAPQESANAEPETQSTEASEQDPATEPMTDYERYVAQVNVEFEHALTSESVKGALLEAALQLGDVPLNEKDVKVLPTGAGPRAEQASQNKEWSVEITVSRKGDAQRVLETMQQNVNSQAYIPNTSAVGGQIAGQARWQALAAMLASLLGIIAYVWIRFQNIAFGLAAVVALLHDILVVLGALAVSSWLSGVPLIDNFKISLPVIAAFLTTIGYSLNDTIVVFDRIREVRGKRTELTRDIINTSISQTLSRTILTSLTTFIVVFILFVLGGDAIHAFAFALVIGVLVGTYSSIFVASPVLLFLMNRGDLPSKPLKNARTTSA